MTPYQLQTLQRLGGGTSAVRLIESGGDPGVLRPWVSEKDGKSYYTIRTGRLIANKKGKMVPETRNIVCNAPALLRREDWYRMDRRVSWLAKSRQKFYKMVKAANNKPVTNPLGVYNIGYTVGDREADVTVSMSPLRRSERTRPVLDFFSTPLPVFSSDGSFDIRELAVSRSGGAGMDTVMMDDGARKIGETLEKMSLGLTPTFTHAGGTIYGLLTHPGRITVTFTSPEAGGWTPKTLVDELLQAILLLENNKFFGPYVMLYSNRWGMFMDRDYASTYGGETLATRLGKLKKITAYEQLDYLPDFSLILVQMTEDVIATLDGMDVQTIQWSESGGMEEMYKVMAIQSIEMRQDFNGNTGVLVGNITAPTTTTSTTTTTTTT